MAKYTNFRIYLQPPYVPGFEQPFLVKVDTGAKSVGPGPADALFYVLDARNKPSYPAEAPHNFQPFRGRPWTGNVNTVIAYPNWDGHFDHLKPDDPAFPAASIYATARLTLNFWNRIFEKAGLAQITEWHHNPAHVIDRRADSHEDSPEELALAARLELIPRCISAGSRAGYGFIEVGRDNPVHKYYDYYDQSGGGSAPVAYQRGAMWQNFDVIAHEIGHAILFKVIDFPARATGVTSWFAIRDPEFLIFHESMADLVAILALLDQEPFIDYLIQNSDGLSILAGVGELQRLAAPGFLPIRSAYNKAKYSGLKAKASFKNEEAHKNSLPLTGSVFDILMNLYGDAENIETAPKTANEARKRIGAARDIMAEALAHLWSNPDHMWEDPNSRRGFSLDKVAKHLPELVGTAAEKASLQGTPPGNSGIAEIAVIRFAMHGLPFLEEGK